MHSSRLVAVFCFLSFAGAGQAMATEGDSCAIPTLKASLSINAAPQKKPLEQPTASSPSSGSAAQPASAPKRLPTYNTSALYKITTARRPTQAPPAVHSKPAPATSMPWHADPKRVAAVAAMINQYKQSGPTSRYASTRNFASETRPPIAEVPSNAAAGAPVKPDNLPRWGDKNCSCHDAGRLFGEHRYLEAAAMYRKTAENMLSAWGHPTKDIANAKRGEAVSYAAAGDAQKARDLYAEAVEIYISSVKGNAPPELQQSINDLSDIYQHCGEPKRSQALRLSALRICALSRVSPALGHAEFHRIMQ